MSDQTPTLSAAIEEAVAAGADSPEEAVAAVRAKYGEAWLTEQVLLEKVKDVLAKRSEWSTD